MSPNRRRLILSVAAFAAAPALARAADKPELIPLKKIFPYYDLFLGIPVAERTKFTLAYYLRVNGKPGAATLWMVGPGGSRRGLTSGPDGRFTTLPSLADFKAGAQIDADKKNTDKYGVAMEMQPLVRMDEVVPASALRESLEQCNTAIRKRAGVIGFAVPKLEQVIFVGAGSGQAVLAGGKTVALPEFKGMPFYRPGALPDVQTLKFAKTPSRAMMTGKTK